MFSIEAKEEEEDQERHEGLCMMANNNQTPSPWQVHKLALLDKLMIKF